MKNEKIQDYNPKVFGNSDLTIAVNQHGINLFIGQNKINFVKCVKIISSEKESPVVEVHFPNANDRYPAIEDYVRALAPFSWITIVRI